MTSLSVPHSLEKLISKKKIEKEKKKRKIVRLRINENQLEEILQLKNSKNIVEVYFLVTMMMMIKMIKKIIK